MTLVKDGKIDNALACTQMARYLNDEKFDYVTYEIQLLIEKKDKQQAANAVENALRLFNEPKQQIILSKLRNRI